MTIRRQRVVYFGGGGILNSRSRRRTVTISSVGRSIVRTILRRRRHSTSRAL